LSTKTYNPFFYRTSLLPSDTFLKPVATTPQVLHPQGVIFLANGSRFLPNY